MSVFTSRPALRWLVPTATAVAVIGGGVAIGALTAAADSTAPTRSAAQLLVDVQTARLDGFSGTVVQRSDLGLPALPVTGSGGPTDLAALLSGTHTIRVWYSGPSKARVAVLGPLGETDVITNGTDLWTWSSRENKAIHTAIPTRDRPGTPTSPGKPSNSGQPGGLPSGGSFTPQQLATLALSVVSPSTDVSTRGSVTVAGRSADELVLTPKDRASLIGSVRLAIDSTEHIPLRVQIFARAAAQPGLEVAFSQVSFARPDDAQFVFNPPPGTTVEQGTPHDKPSPAPSSSNAAKARPTMAVVGTGWTSVVAFRLPNVTTPSTPATPQAAAGKAAADLLAALPKVTGSWGSGRLLNSHLVNVLVTDDGRVLIGAVSPDRLYAAAADPATALPR